MKTLNFSRCGGWVRLAGAMVLVAVVLLSGMRPVHAAATLSEDAIRVKDLGRLQGWRENGLTGYGIVTGLAGTGDSPANRTTRQAMANALAQFNLTVSPDQVQSRNVAVVMVTASLPAFARPGDTLDVVVASAGDARSLVGGALLLTPLQGPDGKVHALAQGSLAVGGYRYDSNGNMVQKNHPTVGAIPGGASVELGTPAPGASAPVTFLLTEPDYTTADRVAAAINSQLGAGIAEARDASAIEIRLPEAVQTRSVAFLSRIENVMVEPDRRAKVVINERTGTIVSGGDVRISKVAVSHGDLRVSVSSLTTASQPLLVSQTAPGVRTAVVTNSRLEVEETAGAGFVSNKSTVADLVQALSRLKTNTRDIISILRAIKAAGALHADLIVQ